MESAAARQDGGGDVGRVAARDRGEGAVPDGERRRIVRELHRKANAAEEAQREAATQKVVSQLQLVLNSNTTCVACLCRVNEIQCRVQADFRVCTGVAAGWDSIVQSSIWQNVQHGRVERV